MLRSQDIHTLSLLSYHMDSLGVPLFNDWTKSLLLMLIMRMLPPTDRKYVILGRFPDVGIQIGSELVL